MCLRQHVAGLVNVWTRIRSRVPLHPNPTSNKPTTPLRSRLCLHSHAYSSTDPAESCESAAIFQILLSGGTLAHVRRRLDRALSIFLEGRAIEFVHPLTPMSSRTYAEFRAAVAPSMACNRAPLPARFEFQHSLPKETIGNCRRTQSAGAVQKSANLWLAGQSGAGRYLAIVGPTMAGRSRP